MRRSIAALGLLLPLASIAQRPWQEITFPSLGEVASHFRTPPREYGAIHWAIWGGELTRERIVREFDSLTRSGIYVVNFGPARGMQPKYLSPEHLALTKFAVEEAAKRGMKVWLADEGSYPSGFAGGQISEDYPQLRMQGIVADIRISVAPGQTISMPAPPDTLAATIVSSAGGGGRGAANPAPSTSEPLAIADGRIVWTAPPEGRREIVLIRHVFRSSPTRYINRADGTYSKDSLYSLIDYLNPEATRAFLKTTHEVYKDLFGGEFGKTVLGFFGDEPDYTGFMPWTPTLLEQFRQAKGYDLQPYLPALFAPQMTPEAWRVKADYWDVWSGIFSKSFFGVQAEWCAKNNLEYLVHLNHEELMLNLSRGEDLIRNEGDFFRDMRYVEVPGVDNLSQLRPELVNREDAAAYSVNNNFPKLASSAAHLFGRPKAWTEEGGGLGVEGKFQLDYQLVEGMTAMQLQGALGRGGAPASGVAASGVPASGVPTSGVPTSGVPASGVAASGPGSAAGNPEPSPAFPLLAAYTNRAGYLMSIGRPAAQVALYHPASSMWLGDEDADRSTTRLSKELLEHQIDFDYMDEQSLSSVATLEKGGFRNLSGQVYRAVIVPSSSVISRASLDRLRAFAASGGKVVFAGKTPGMVLETTFLQLGLSPGATPDLGFAAHEPSSAITAAVIAALPKPDFALDRPCPAIRYTHRSWRDGELYFIFNESNLEQSRVARIDGHGQAQIWDLATGLIHPVRDASPQPDGVELPLVLAPYEARVVVVGPMPPAPDVSGPAPSLGTRQSILDLAGDWSLQVDGKSLTTPLKSWQDLGVANIAAPALYRKEFTLDANGRAGRLWQECGDVRDYARVRLNGKDLEAHAWQPYRWEITSAVKGGSNMLEIEVRSTPAGRGPAPVPATPGAAPAPGRGTISPQVSGLLGPVRLVSYQ